MKKSDLTVQEFLAETKALGLTYKTTCTDVDIWEYRDARLTVKPTGKKRHQTRRNYLAFLRTQIKKRDDQFDDAGLPKVTMTNLAGERI
jgi:hypothetical protein